MKFCLLGINSLRKCLPEMKCFPSNLISYIFTYEKNNKQQRDRKSKPQTFQIIQTELACTFGIDGYERRTLTLAYVAITQPNTKCKQRFPYFSLIHLQSSLHFLISSLGLYYLEGLCSYHKTRSMLTRQPKATVRLSQVFTYY